MNNTTEGIELSYVNIRYEKPIICYEYKKDIELGFPEIRELIAFAEKLSNGKPYVTFADVQAKINITNEGKKVMADINNMPLFRGRGILVKNNFFKIAANFTGNYNKPKYPFRAFTSKEEAMAWLLSLPLD